MDILKKLRDVKLRPTKQRILLANLILDGKNNISLPKKFKKKYQQKGHNISLATIYNCLNKFVNVGLFETN